MTIGSNLNGLILHSQDPAISSKSTCWWKPNRDHFRFDPTHIYNQARTHFSKTPNHPPWLRATNHFCHPLKNCERVRTGFPFHGKGSLATSKKNINQPSSIYSLYIYVYIPIFSYSKKQSTTVNNPCELRH